MATASETLRLPTNLDIQGDLLVRGQKPLYDRTDFVQDDFAVHAVPWTFFRVWDAIATNAPGTSATDDLGLYAGAFGTGVPYLATSDLKAAGSTTRYTRFAFMLPDNYVAGQSVRIRFSAGAITTIADTAMTLDVEVYKSARDSLKTGSDLVTTAAQSINSVTFADTNFDLTVSGLSPGDWLDVRIALLVNDAATATAVIGAIGAVEMLIDVKG